MANRHLWVRLGVLLRGARASGFRATIGARIARAVRDTVVWAVGLPITLILHALGYRRLNVITGRIGHLAAEIDCFVKARTMGDLPQRRYFVLAPAAAVANQHLLNYWRPHVRVVTHGLACALLSGMSRWGLMRFDVRHYVLRLNATQDLYRINARWHPRPPVLTLSDADRAWGDDALGRLGLPAGAWFICIHVREPGYFPSDESGHAHRNGDPRALVPAVNYIAQLGGWCIRMGDASMTALPRLPNLIDYARHDLKSDRLDVVLCARARFFLGNTSGIALLSTVFGVPCALANMIPTATLAPLHSDISIPKLLFSRAKQRLLRFDEILGSPLANFRYAALYETAGIDARENSPEDILDLVREMISRTGGTFSPSEDDRELQRRFMALLCPGDYSWGTSASMGAVFLRRHRDLLPPESPGPAVPSSMRQAAPRVPDRR